VLARIAQIPCVMASIGAQKALSSTSRLFMSVALRLSNYRSYRDKHSREIVAGLLQRANEDPVVPDLALSLPPMKLPLSSGVRTMAQGRPIIAISPIAYAKPGNWPCPDRALYDRYLQQMALVVSQFLNRGCFLVMVCSSLGDDESVIPDLLGRLDDEARKRLALQMHIPTITTWKDVVASLREVDVLIASRLHSTILGFVTQTPTVAISFDPKVDWVMEDLGQTDYLLQIRDFMARDAIEAVDRIELCKSVVLKQIASYQHRITSVCALQYDALAELAMTSCQCRH
jgi:polysaccharide pyruvyl transferase WcaK-like protein